MADSSVSALSAGLAPSAGLLQVLLNISQSGIMLLGPVFDTDGTTVVDLTVEYLNPAAQRMLRQPERPAESFRTLYPTAEAAGVFAFYRDAFLSGEVARRRNNYQYDGLDGYYHLVAQRQGEVLVVNFTDGADSERTAIEEELRASQVREFEARAAAETERNLFEAVLTQSPVAIGLLQGDDCVVTTANEAMCAIWGHPAEEMVGRPLLEGVPELRGQGFTDIMREVARTQQPYTGTEVAADLLRNGRVETTYYNFVYKPLYGPGGEVLGVIDIAIEVTEQVVARRRVQELNEELAVINEELASTNEELASTNEELRASNDEFLYTNAALTTSQNDLYALNRELEARVVERTTQLQAQQHLLRQILSQIPASIATLAGPEHRYSFFNDYHRQFSGDRAVQHADGAGKEAPAIDDRWDLVVAHRVERLAAVQGLQRGEAVGLALDRIGNAQEIGGPFPRCRARPGGKGCLGGADRGVNLGMRRFGKGEDRLSRLRVENLLFGFGAWLEACADQKVGVHGRSPVCRSVHLPAPAIWSPSRVRK